MTHQPTVLGEHAEDEGEHSFEACGVVASPDEVAGTPVRGLGLASIVQEASEARNGWKVILSRCAPEKRSARRSSVVAGIGG